MANEQQKKQPAKALCALAVAAAVYLLSRLLWPLVFRMMAEEVIPFEPVFIFMALDFILLIVVCCLTTKLMYKRACGKFAVVFWSAVSAFIASAIGVYFPDIPGQMQPLVRLLVYFLAGYLCAVSAVMRLSQPVVDKAKLEADKKLEKWRPFYEECAKFKIRGEADLQAADKHQRAELVAQKHNLTFNQIEELFRPGYEGWDLYTAVIRAEAEEKMEKKRSEERDAVAASERCKALRGVEKRVTMLSETIQGYRELNQSLQRLINGVHLEKESDGAVMAGVASGIGGVIPAAMSLNNTARMNAEIRDRNALPKQMIQTYVNMQLNNTGFRMFWEKELERAKTKLISDQPAEEVFTHLSIETKSVTVTETGSIQVQARVKGDAEYTIFDKMPAIIDGTIVAKIHEGDTLVGEALLSLPAYGTGLYKLNTRYDEITHGYSGYKEGAVRLKRAPASYDHDLPSFVEVKGYCLFAGQEGHTYTVTYEPGQLWGMEL
ncbi:MAG: hypothetical protein HFF17_02380 [Oscillospiraceae bacterium]|nr:hypothetical protein [Oscillospiraceae bacterium]